MKIHKESGNALWFILLAVALIAALTFAVTRSSDTSEQANVTEHDTIAANEVLRTAKGIEEAVSRMRMTGMPENNVSFYTADTMTAYLNTNCTDPACEVFGAGGGGISYQSPDDTLNDGTGWIITSNNAAAGVGTALPDLMLILPNVNSGVCNALNALLKTTMGAADTDIDFTPYTGGFPATAAATIDAAGGAKAGCQNNTGGTYKDFYYHVLIPR